jgi:hypothetical protein
MIMIFLRSLDFTGPWQVFQRERYLMILEGIVKKRENACCHNILPEFSIIPMMNRLAIQERIYYLFVIRIYMAEVITEKNLLSGVKSEMMIKKCH